MSLESILQRRDVWRGSHAPSTDVIPSGYAELDRVLPGGWLCGALTEIHLPLEGVGELRLLLPALTHLSRGDRWIVLIAPRYVPYAPALAAAGMDLSRLLLVRPRTRADHLWAIESGLRSGACAAVLAWAEDVTAAYLRRWQLAAEIGKAWGVLFQRHPIADSPAAVRLRVMPEVKGAVTVNILKRRNGWSPGPVRLEIDHAVAVRTSPGSGARSLQPRRVP